MIGSQEKWLNHVLMSLFTITKYDFDQRQTSLARINDRFDQFQEVKVISKKWFEVKFSFKEVLEVVMEMWNLGVDQKKKVFKILRYL